MSFLANVKDRFGKLTKSDDSPLYRLHPELKYWDHLFSDSSNSGITIDKYADAAKVFQSYTWVRKAVSVKANAVAPLRRRVVDANGDEVKGHQVTDLLSNVKNETNESTAVEAWGAAQVDMDLAGESFLEIVDDSQGQPAELWRRAANIVNVHPDQSKERAYFPRVAAYSIDDQEDDKIAPENMIHIKYYNPLNKWRGMGLISAVREGIIIDVYAQAWSKMMLKGGARPDFIVVAPQGITRTEREDLEMQLLQKHRGPSNWHRPIIVEQGVTDVKPISWAPADIQWLEQRKFARDEVGAIFGVPDEIMGYGKDTYENFDVAYYILWTLTLISGIGYIDVALTSFFVNTRPMLAPGERIATDLSEISVLQEDLGQKLEQAGKLFEMGYSPNQVNERLKLGMPDVPWGDVGYMPANMTPVTMLGRQQMAAGPVTHQGKRAKLPGRKQALDACLTGQLDNEQCPICKQTDAVYTGHGDVRHCTRCVISWAKGETEVSRRKEIPAEWEMPEDMQDRLDETIAGLTQASGLDERLARLNDIPDSEFE